MPVEIIPLSEVKFSDFVETFNAAYADYVVDIQLDPAGMRRIVKRNDIDLAASRMAFFDGKPAGIGMLARRRDQGWIGGLGVVPLYRRQGLARQIMLALLASARERSIQRIRLEVIQGNTPAYLLYHSLSFRVLRQLFIVEGHEMPEKDFSGIEVRSVSPREALVYFNTFHAIANPWQRELPALRSLSDEMSCMVALQHGRVQAYAVGWFYQDIIRWMDMACAPGQSLALQAIITRVHSLNRTAHGSLINIGDDDPAWSALEAMHYQPTLRQFEMELIL